MPNYPNASGTTTVPVFPPFSLSPGDSGPLAFVFFNAEQPAAPQASDRVAIAKSPSGFGLDAISIEGIWSADPGVFEVDVQESDTDADAFYQTVTGGIISANGIGFAFRADLQFRAKFIRLLLKTRTNAVNFTAKGSR